MRAANDPVPPRLIPIEMRNTFGRSLLLPIAFLLCLICVSGSASPPSRETLGISPKDEGYYKSNVIKCKGGSGKFAREQLNDDFCDCVDGTDEPGTSACPEGKFYCRNTGHTPITIFSSRVNDGICDCCDGSDEYDGKIKCSNTCWEAGKVAREKLKKKIATYQEGVTIRRQEVGKAQAAFTRDEKELTKLKSEEKVLKGLVEKLKEQKDQIEKAEEQERKKREKEEQRLRELEKKESEHHEQSEESIHDDARDANEKLSESINQREESKESDDSATEDEDGLNDEHKSAAADGVGQHMEEHDDATLKTEAARNEEATPQNVAEEEEKDSVNADGLSKEDLGRLVASRWTGENVAHKTDMDNTEKDENKENLDFPESAEGEDYDGYNSETDDDRHKYGDEDDIDDSNTHEYGGDHAEPEGDYDPISEDKVEPSDFTDSKSSSWLDKLHQTVQNLLNAVNMFKTPVDISEAARIRKEYDDASSKLSKMQSRISSLNEKLKHDFGWESEFYSFYDHCFETKQTKYVYKVCPFKQASQVEGHSNTRLGQWEKFDEAYRVMQFSNGERCWNGPDRSLKVRLRCGLKNELTDVDEPSRCEYVAFLSTPALCVEEKLKELQDKLQLMNSGQPLSHDEL